MGGGKGGGGGGISYSQQLAMQRTLQQESFAMQQEAALAQEERAAARREAERVAELERRREAELERAAKIAEEEKRESILMGEAEGLETEVKGMGSINLDAPQIEQPDYAPRTELE